MIRAAIVGLGWWGKVLVDAVQDKSSAIRFVAAHTRSHAKLQDFCRERHIDLRGDLDSLLRDPTIDAIVCATPHREHEQQIEQIAAAGKHIYIEKPLTLTLSDAQAAIAAARAAGVTLAVGFQRRHTPSHLELKARVRSGQLGSIVHCAGEAMAPGALTLPQTSWRADADEMPAGAMTPMGIHVLDGMIDLFGEIEDVYCINLRRGSPHVDDTTSVLMSLRNGASASLICSMATARNYRVIAYGTQGSGEALRAAREAFNFVPALNPPQSAAPQSKPESIEFHGAEPEKASLEAFAAAIEAGQKFPIAARELLQGVAAFEAIVQSATTRQTVKVATID
jgi:predicted dehydrogenase